MGDKIKDRKQSKSIACFWGLKMTMAKQMTVSQNINISHNQPQPDCVEEISISRVCSRTYSIRTASDDIKTHLENKLPCNEENFAFLAIFFRHKVKIVDCISALIRRKACTEILIALQRVTKLFYNDLLHLFLYLEYYKTVCSLCFQLQELKFAFIIHCHP
ncbi:hypothetical protein CKAN_02479300 [Cinnamomum micranthum f. kanehirae]|uniref:Uncharacterized protein n=1 Tax=Cinnamomum micranthum f. kanehirae TaxID=337451 RepID=A0A3S3R747_9MAGN|nr:hypothetical protein CKAN_02479300 [Cinnamomum micranthum f. kanehirae]